MPEPRLTVRSAKACAIAHRLARRENCSLTDVVERALESYEVRETGREPASVFYARLSAEFGTDVDLEAVIREHRRTLIEDVRASAVEKDIAGPDAERSQDFLYGGKGPPE